MSARSLPLSLAACALIAGTFGSAHAVDKQGWYVGAGVGYAQNKASDINFISGTSEKNNATGFKLYSGYQFNQNWATELEYLNFGKYNADSANLHSSAKSSGFGVSMIGSLPLSNQFALFGKVGAFAKLVDLEESSNSGNYHYSEKSTTLTPLLGAGVEFRFTPATAVRVEYEYAGKTKLGTNDAKLNNSLLSVSTRFSF